MIRAISDLCSEGRSICYGIVQPGRHIDGGLPILRVANLRGDRIDTSDVMRVDPEIEEKYKRSRIQENDVLVSLVGSMGQVAIAGREVAGWNVARAVGIIPAADRHHAEWIRYSLQSREAQQFIADHANTTVQATFNLRDLSRLPIPYPDEGTRKDILSILTALDDKIELNRRMSATLEEMARALYRSWFVDFDPVHARALGQPPAHMDPTTAALFPDSFNLDGLPKGWEAGTLGDIASNIRRQVQPGDIEAVIPYIGLEHMPRRSIALSDWGEAGQVGSAKSAMRRGQILFGKLRPYFHKVGIVPTDGICSTDILVIDAKANRWREMVLNVVSSDDFVEHANATSSGTRMPRSNWKDMARFDIAVPPEAVLEAFSSIVRPMTEKIVAGIHEAHTLAALRDTLLPRIMSGELRIREAEKQVEEVL